MRLVLPLALSLAVSVAIVPAAYAQQGSETFATSGTINGQELVAITINYDNRSVIFHFEGGSQFTRTDVSQREIEQLAESLRERPRTAPEN